MNNQFIKRFFAFFIVFQLLLSTFGSYDAYAKDKTAPNIKCYVYTDVNNGKLKLKITVTDNSAVKAIKYAVGKTTQITVKIPARIPQTVIMQVIISVVITLMQTVIKM